MENSNRVVSFIAIRIVGNNVWNDASCVCDSHIRDRYDPEDVS